MPTTAQINAASATLDETARGQWKTFITEWIRKNNVQAGLYPNIEQKIASATAIQARQLNAALALIDEIGDGTVALTGGADAVDYSQDRDRDALISYGLSVLYDQPLRKSSVASGQMKPIAHACSTCSICGLSSCSHLRC